MGKKTHGPYLVAAIELNDIQKVSDILSTKFRDKSKVKHFLVSEVRRLASEYTEVPLLQAAVLPEPTILQYFVTKHETNINFVYEYGFPGTRRKKTALLVAVRRGLYNMVDAILSMNGDVNVQDHKGRTPLHHAVRRADNRMAKLLLSHGAQASVADMAGNAPLHIATIFGHTEMVRLILRQGGDLYKKGQHKAIPIHIAAREGHASLVRMFVEQYEVNADIKIPCYDDHEKAPIHVAASEGHYETVFTLLEYCSANVNIQDSDGETALHCAMLNEYDPLGMKSKDDFTETIKVLLNFGAAVNIRNARGESALHLAARNEFQKAVEVLVVAGCDPLIEDNDRNKAIDLVAEDDSVSKQTLKNAMLNRERIMSESREIRAKGFTTSLQHQLPLSQRSQSTVNLPMAGMHNMSLMSSRYTSAPYLAQPAMMAMMNSSSRLNTSVNINQSSHSSSSSSKRRSNQSVQSGFRPPNGIPVPALRKTKSVEELDQPHDTSRYNGSKSHGRHRAGSYQESEASSFWAITPPGSVKDVGDIEHQAKSKRIKTKIKTKKVIGNRLIESDEELEDVKYKSKSQPALPIKFKKAADLRASGDNDSDDYFLDDDDSVDALDLKKKPLPQLPLKKPASRPFEGSNPNLESWLDEQARLLKEKAVGPVAHSTPPQSRAHNKDTDSSTTDSEAPVLPKTRPKPVPPPKPSKDRTTSMTSAETNKDAKATLGNSNIVRTQQHTKSSGSNKVIQLDVDENSDLGETVISITPVNPPGPPRVQTLPYGVASSTFLNLKKTFSGNPDSPKPGANNLKSKKPDISQSGHSNVGRGDGNLIPIPIPRPRESKNRSQLESSTESESSTNLSDEETFKKTSGSRGVKNVASTIKQPPAVLAKHTPIVEQKSQHKPAGLVFQKTSSGPSNGGDLSYSSVDDSRTTRKMSASDIVSVSSKSKLMNTSVGSESVVNSRQEQFVNKAAAAPELRHGSKSKQLKEESDAEYSDESNESDERQYNTRSEETLRNNRRLSSNIDYRTVTYYNDGQLRCTIVGGNVEGIYVHAIDQESDAAINGLMAGDQIIKANSKAVIGKMREEAVQMLREMTGELSLVVCNRLERCRTIIKNGGMGDAFCVRAQFAYDAAKKGELSIRVGDIFSVQDTLPDGNVGYWKARKIEPKKKKVPTATLR